MNREKKTSILTLTGFYVPGYKGGGPIKTIKNLIDQTSSVFSFKVLTSNHDLGETTPYKGVKSGAWNSVEPAKVFYADKGLKGFRQITSIIVQEQYDIIYLNSFFSFRFSIYPLILAKLFRKKVVLGPRGEFSAGALAIKSRKKNIFLRIYNLLNLQKNIIFQASSQFEAADIRAVLGPKVDAQIAKNISSAEFGDNLPKKSNHHLNIVFLSRISPMKNLHGALKLLAQVNCPVSYDIYGPIEDKDYWQKCQSLIQALPEHIKVSYKGGLTPPEVIPTLSKYDLFFMPTKGENYGHVIAEALSAGLPILISDRTPWRDLQAQGIGWDLPLEDQAAFIQAIHTTARMTKHDHHTMRCNVLDWAKEKFSQKDAIMANIALFKYAHSKK